MNEQGLVGRIAECKAKIQELQAQLRELKAECKAQGHTLRRRSSTLSVCEGCGELIAWTCAAAVSENKSTMCYFEEVDGKEVCRYCGGERV